MNLEFAKKVALKLGLFPISYSIYKRISPRHRRERKYNNSFYQQIVSPGDLCFDIGANLGQTAEALLNAGAVVVSVEPNPKCLPVLQFEFQNVSDLVIVNKAIGNTKGITKLNIRGVDPTASIRKDWPFEYSDVVEVEMTTLDDLIQEFGCPKFVKVDVEGFEIEVFQGLSQPIPLIYFEMHRREKDRVIKILDSISQIGEILSVNVVNSDHSAWLLNEWVTPDQLFKKLADSLPGRANVVVKMRI